MACGCCTQPICEVPVIEGDPIAASRTKCGVTTGWSAPPKLYLSMTDTLTMDGASGSTGTRVITTTLDGATCLTTVECTGSVTYDESLGGGTCDPCVSTCLDTVPVTGDQESYATSDTTAHVADAGLGFERDWTLSSEYDTDLLISTTEAALPAYPGTFLQPIAEAIKQLSSDETSYTLQRVKWRLHHQPTATCYLRVWLRTRFRPEGTAGEADVLTDLTDYLWSLAGTPCLPAPAAGLHAAGNQIYSPVQEILEPEEDGVVTVEIKKWSCLAGYLPADPLADGTRPDPDPTPNGFRATA